MAFNCMWQYYWASTQVLDKIVIESIPIRNEKNTYRMTTINKNEKCYDHRIQVLKYMMTIKIYSCTRYNNRAAKTANIPFYRKV